MDTSIILNDLRAERDRINQAIAALESLNGIAPLARSASQPQTAPRGRGGKRRISAAGRRRISEAAKRRWAVQKAKTAKPKASAKLAAPKPTAPKRGMSAAARKRMAEMMKKRWAAKKKAAAKA